MTFSRPDILRILDDEGIRPSKAMGQNFVADPNTVRRIARLAGVGPGDRVVEIGAGLGSLTLALAETGAAIVAVEKDKRLAPALRRLMTGDNHINIVEGDALTLDWSTLLHGGDAWVLVANLPYNIATPLVITVLEDVPQVSRMLVMVQREVGERMIARARDDAYGAVSVKVTYWTEARIAGKVPASVFLPRPNVESVLVELVRREEVAVPPSVASYESLCRVVNAGFAKRRKMLRNALEQFCGLEGFVAADVDPTARAEELDIGQWGRLAAAVESEQ